MPTEPRHARPRPPAHAQGAAAFHGPLTAAAVSGIMATLAKRIEPRTELQYATPFELLVAVVLSAQATDRSVNAATRTLFPVARTAEAMLRLGVDGLKEHIKSIGLFNTKAANIIALSRQLIEQHGGHVPAERENLEALPGVGRKTANVVLNVAFGQPTLAVDTHVHRGANRTGMVRAATVEQTEQALLERIPKRFLMHAHHYLILHGRYCCTARAPACATCPIRGQCLFPDKR